MKRFNMITWSIVATLAITLLGCSHSWYQRRDIERLDALAMQQQPEFLKLSNMLNPCFNGIAKSDTQITQGKTDTIFKKGDVMVISRNDTVFQTIHDTIYYSHTVIKSIHDTVSDQRAINSVQSLLKTKSDSLVTTKTKLSDTSASKTHWMWIAIGCMVLIIVVAAIKVYKLFSGGAIADVVKKVV